MQKLVVPVTQEIPAEAAEKTALLMYQSLATGPARI